MKKNPRPRILFAMAHAGFFRNFDRTINHLLDAGYDVTLVLCKTHKSINIDDHPLVKGNRITTITADFGSHDKVIFHQKLRVYRDILFYAREEFREATGLRERFVTQQKKDYINSQNFYKWLAYFESLPGKVRKRFALGFSLAEGLATPHKTATRIIKEVRPDLVIVSPLVSFFNQEIEFVKAAKRQKIPTVFTVASWDNLTNKGIVKVQPDLVAVWNRHMAEEATKMHAIPADNIVITGATVFDWWFAKYDVWSRKNFFLEANQSHTHHSKAVATLLYLCSSASISSGSEIQLIEKWLNAVRKSRDPRIKNARIIVRMHPMNTRPWTNRIASQQELTAQELRYSIYPTNVTHPTSDEQRACFLNTVYHADAVIGLNTSAMIEAAIMGKPVLTFKGHDKENAQANNLHFRHLVDSGCVKVSDSLPLHIKELSKVLGKKEAIKTACREFVARFVRPRGLEFEAAKCLANEIDNFFKKQNNPKDK